MTDQIYVTKSGEVLTEAEVMAFTCCPNCGERGHPMHHWMDQADVFTGYICFGRDTRNA